MSITTFVVLALMFAATSSPGAFAEEITNITSIAETTSQDPTNSTVGEVTAERRVWVTYQQGMRKSLLEAVKSKQTGNVTAHSMKIHYDMKRSRALVLTASAEAIDELESLPFVELVEDDLKRYPQMQMNSVRSLEAGVEAIPYGISMVQADQVWDKGYTGTGVKVCVIDSGIDQPHEDFIPSHVDGASANFQSWTVDGVGHGTHCSGTIAASTNGLGVVGVAPDAEIFHIKVFGNRGLFVYSSSLVDASYECLAQGANIVSMSLGGSGSTIAESRGFEDLKDDGVLVIAAAGNSGNSDFSYPASYPDVLSVAALDSSGTVASFSQFNSMVDLAAPGVDVLSTLPMDGDCQMCSGSPYGFADGTSMATPHVSGVAALLYNFLPDASVDEIEEALLMSAQDLGEDGRDDYYGHGLVKAMAAIEHLNGGPLPLFH